MYYVPLAQPNPDFTAAQQLCEDIIDSEKFSLEEDFYDVFYNELNDFFLKCVCFHTQ